MTVLGVSTVSVAADPIPKEAFARLPAFADVGISPDGRFLSAIQSSGDKRGAVVMDLRGGAAPRVVMGEDKDGHFRMTWCNWANDTRLICGFRAMRKEGGMIFPITRMAAVNADGSDVKVLIQNGRAGASQYQDSVLDWTPDDPNTVLVEVDEDRNTFPEVYELNVYSGQLRLRVRERQPIRDFRSDGRGNVRLGSGFEGKDFYYFARLADDSSWIRLEKFKAFSEGDRFTPIAITPGTNKMYASGPHEGRDALWQVDLTDRDNPVLVFSHPLVDADRPILARDGRMLGVFYETDRPFAFYTDAVAQSIVESAKRLLPAGSFNMISDYSRDEKSVLLSSSSDIDDGTYYVLDRAAGKLQRVGTRYPEIDKRQSELARVQSISYEANDGTEIPGYLTVPAGKRAERLPLIVMPHGGPVSRDSLEFSWLVQFLAHRGYAVLQMNFRGSSGYGTEWLYAGHQDWGGLTYSDIVDGTRWAIKQGIADPKRVCIVGWSFGGYAALLGAVRSGDLYKCSASIAGVSDLIQLQDDQRGFTSSAIAREQIGVDRDKLKADSPRRHAESASVPVLLVHGDNDYQVRIEHSEDMAGALKRAKKNYRMVTIEGANHQLDRQSDRMTLLTELEAFLSNNL
jgi:dipeptidyl aminopeptidase/acylaminoacyl peptidase